MHTSLLWCRGQRDAYSQLMAMAQLFFFTDWSPRYRLKPRLNPLVAGPSGIGKSHLIQALADELEMPMLRVTPSSWMLCGAKDQVSTLSRIYEFVVDNDVGIISIDEADKFYSSAMGDWSRYVRGEAFDLMDRQIVATHPSIPWTEFTIEKIRRNFMIVGTGTWQTLWDQPTKPALGFGISEKTEERDIAREIRESGQIPTELLRRFNSAEIIIIPPATEEDYRDAAAQFGLIKLALELKIKLNFAEAAQRGLGARWFEEQFTKLLLVAREKNRTDLYTLRNPFQEEEPDIDEDQGESYEPVL